MTESNEHSFGSCYRYYLNIGSNLGNPRNNIARAIRKIESCFGHGVSSDMVESAPWGFDSTNSFCNIGYTVDSPLNPLKMLDMLKHIERDLSAVPHRNPDGSYRDREIDIDIMAAADQYGEISISSPQLSLPHPHLEDREFFNGPLKQMQEVMHFIIRTDDKRTYLLLDCDNNVPSLSQTAIAPLESVFHLEKNAIATEVVNEYAPEGMHWVELRSSWQYIGDRLWALASKGAELIYWDQETQFCGRCGSVMYREGEIEKRCHECGAIRFPRLSPCVLVLVEDGDRALLVHNRAMRSGLHALVAGFVETGESLEDCVKREVAEETGLQVDNLKYFGSQSWPFPGQLMMAFRCRLVGGNLHWADGELNAGGFFTRQDVECRQTAEGNENDTFSLPSLPSLSRRLIDSWLADTTLNCQ